MTQQERAELKKAITKGIDEKAEAMYRRWLYTQSKTAGTEAEREEARQKYLDEVGILPDFRW